MKFPEPVEFLWDRANKYKNLETRKVTADEIEQVFFFDHSKKTFLDIVHSSKELRYRVVGKTRANRLLFVVFTVRSNTVRVISARDLNKKEHILYEKRA